MSGEHDYINDKVTLYSTNDSRKRKWDDHGDNNKGETEHSNEKRAAEIEKVAASASEASREKEPTGRISAILPEGDSLAKKSEEPTIRRDEERAIAVKMADEESYIAPPLVVKKPSLAATLGIDDEAERQKVNPHKADRFRKRK